MRARYRPVPTVFQGVEILGAGAGAGSALAVDVGGTKLAAALIDSDGTVRRRHQVATGPDPWRQLEELMAAALGGEPAVGVGLSCGGPMRWPEGFVSPHNMRPWRGGFALRDRVRERFPGLPVRLYNDVIALAVGEHWQGAGRGVPDLLGMVVSTGVGGGVLQGGRVVPGRTGNAGHVGHVVVEPDGPACGCGGHGCVEAIARGPATVAWARGRGSTAVDGRELAAYAAHGEPVAVAALARAGRALALGIAAAAAMLDLEVVVLGGGLSQAGEPLWAPLRATLREHARLPFLTGLRVLPTALGQDSCLVGAGAMVLCGDTYWSPPADQ